MRSFAHHLSSASRLVTLALIAALAAGCAMFQGEQSPGEYMDDATLTARVKAALLDDEQVKGTSINVNVYDGKVTLSGYADSPEVRQRAVEIARQVPGVKDVESTINVAQGGSDRQTN